jgi:hypothetical protein
VDRVAGWGLVAEVGINMAVFPSASHLASWGGMCPGNHESAAQCSHLDVRPQCLRGSVSRRAFPNAKVCLPTIKFEP